MGELELPGDVLVALSHTAAYGLAAILEAAGTSGVCVRWTASLDARAVVTATGLDAYAMASRVLDDARRQASPDSWTTATVDVAGKAGKVAGRLSPRIKPPADDAAWRDFVGLRRETIDAEIARREWLDLALIGALGEPAWWRFNPEGKRSPDEGASRWEMKTRNAGEDFVRHRLHPLAVAVAARDVAAVRAGLLGDQVADEAGGNQIDSRTGTGLAGLGPVDNALAWCALRGLSLLPVIPRVLRPSETAGYGTARQRGQTRENWFHLPVPLGRVTLARLRSVIASEQLATIAATGRGVDSDSELEARSAREWLLDRSVGAIVRFPIGTFGSANAPERRALRGSVLPLDG